jgi:hypothetical protein
MAKLMEPYIVIHAQPFPDLSEGHRNRMGMIGNPTISQSEKKRPS